MTDRLQPVAIMQEREPEMFEIGEEMNEQLDDYVVVHEVHGDTFLCEWDEEGDWYLHGEFGEVDGVPDGIYESTDTVAQDLRDGLFILGINGEPERFIAATHD